LIGVRALKFAPKIDPRDEVVSDLKSCHADLEVGGPYVLGSPPAFRRERSKGWFGERNTTVCDWALSDQESGLSFIVGPVFPGSSGTPITTRF